MVQRGPVQHACAAVPVRAPWWRARGASAHARARVGASGARGASLPPLSSKDQTHCLLMASLARSCAPTASALLTSLSSYLRGVGGAGVRGRGEGGRNLMHRLCREARQLGREVGGLRSRA